MMNELIVLPEPQLQFRHRQNLVAPHDGLSMFGPFDADLPEHPASLSYAIVGTSDGLRLADGFFNAVRNPLTNNPDDLDPRLWPTYPGYEAAFQSRFPDRPTIALEL